MKHTHHVTNSAIWDCRGWCMSLLRSAKINVDSNNFYGATQVGVRVDYTSKLTFNNNFIGAVKIKNDLDISSCMTVGSFTNTPSTLTGLVMTNNIAGGCVTYGFNAPGHECGKSKTQTTFRNNVAHSVGGGDNGIGAAIYPNESVNPKAATCYEASHFTAYKCV